MKRLILIALAAGCVENKPGIEGTQSLRIELVSPTNPGNVNMRLPDSQRMVTVNVEARDADNNIDTSFTDTVRVYAQFLGTLTPELNQMPLAMFPLVDGVAMNRTITLPPSVLGPATLWFDNGFGLGADYVHGAITGTSDTLWYRDPFISDLQTPRDEMAVDALSRTPLSDKQISVSASRHGANGRLIVTSTFAQGYTVADVMCGPGGAPPCTAGPYDHVMVFTFSAPRDQFGRSILVGRLVERFVGGLSEFNGLTEVGFPRTFSPEGPDEAPMHFPALLPAPVLLDAETTVTPATWFSPLSDPDGMINFERNEAGPIEIRNAKICPTDDDYDTYKQWKIDPFPTGTCTGNRLINVITAGTDFTTDPRTLVGRTLTSIVGILRPVNIGSFNVWIIYPRGADDIRLQ